MRLVALGIVSTLLAARPAFAEPAETVRASALRGAMSRRARPGERELGSVLDQMKGLPHQLRRSGFFRKRFHLDAAQVSHFRHELHGAARALAKANRPSEAAAVERASSALGELSLVKSFDFEHRVKLSSTLIDLRMLHLKLAQPELAKPRDKNASLVFTALTGVQKAGLNGALGSRGAWPLLANAQAALRKLELDSLDPAVIGGKEIIDNARETTAVWGERPTGPGVYMNTPARELDGLLTQLRVAGNARHPDRPTAVFDLMTGEQHAIRRADDGSSGSANKRFERDP